MMSMNPDERALDDALRVDIGDWDCIHPGGKASIRAWILEDRLRPKAKKAEALMAAKDKGK